MSLVNFSQSSLTQLKSLLGSFGNEELERQFTSSVPYVESRWFKVTEAVDVTEGEDTSTEYKAEEVYPDGTAVSAGIVFDSDATPSNKPSDPTYFKNLKINSDLYTGAIEVNKAYQVEAVWPNDASGEIVYYIIPKGGGGGGDVRLLMNGTALEKGVPFENGASIVGYDNTVITSGVTIVQNVFDTANIYSGEILYAYINEDGNYALDKALLGV
jgi:hypothetical protein